MLCWRILISILVFECSCLCGVQGASFKNDVGDGITNLTSVQKNKVCQKMIRLRDKVGALSSPNYPLPYDNNITCLWQIRSELGYVVRLSFKDFNLEGGVTDSVTGKLVCAYDFVHIFERFRVESDKEGRSSNSRNEQTVVLQKVWGTYCGSRPPQERTATLSGGTLNVYFVSDQSKSGRGFLATYEQIKFSDVRGRQSDWDDEVEDSKKMFNFYLGIFLTMTIGVVLVIASLCKLINKAFEYDEDSDRRRNFCCGTITIETEEEEYISDPPSNGSPPTPPPPYRDVVKTEDDWLRVVRQFGPETAAALRRSLATDDVSVTYDLNEPESTASNNTTSSSNDATTTSSNTAPVARSGCLATVSALVSPPKGSAPCLINTQPGPGFFRNIRSARVAAMPEGLSDQQREF